MAILEIAIDSLNDGIAAFSAGADRLEVCGRLDVGGITPEERLMHELRERVEDPITAMVRPRAGDFVYTSEEFTVLLRSIDAAKLWDADGIVTGVLTRENTVDVPRLREIVERARPLHVTFHRAFDRTPDLERSLDELMSAGVKRVLTSGGSSTAEEGFEKLAQLVARGGREIVVMPGGGVRPSNIRSILDSTKAREVHSAARDEHGSFQSAIVRSLKEIVESPRTTGEKPSDNPGSQR